MQVQWENNFVTESFSGRPAVQRLETVRPPQLSNMTATYTPATCLVSRWFIDFKRTNQSIECLCVIDEALFSPAIRGHWGHVGPLSSIFCPLFMWLYSHPRSPCDRMTGESVYPVLSKPVGWQSKRIWPIVRRAVLSAGAVYAGIRMLLRGVSRDTR